MSTLVLSFRDIASPTFSAVTPAEFFNCVAPPAPPWWPPPGLSKADDESIRMQLRGQRVCFVVHGFNVDRDDGYTGLGVFSQETGAGAVLPTTPAMPSGAVDLRMPEFDLVLPTLWAGDFFHIPANYPFLLGAIRETGRYFAELIAQTQMASVSFVTHSMGARVVLEAVQQYLTRKNRPYNPPLFECAVFTAAAVTDQVFDDPLYAEAVTKIERFVIVSSTHDEVLGGAFPLGNAAEEAMWPNDWGENIALGFSGPVLKPDSPAKGKVEWYPAGILNHGDYLPHASRLTAGYPNGWSVLPIDVGKLARAAFVRQTPPWPPSAPVKVAAPSR